MIKNFFNAFIFLLLIHGSVHAQDPIPAAAPTVEMSNGGRPNTAEVAGAQSKITSVDHYRGALAVTIPVFNVQERSLSLPISLVYDGSGVKVDQKTSWVGLQWNLKGAGGSITRTVRGTMDEQKLDGYIIQKNYPQRNYLDVNAYSAISSSYARIESARLNDLKLACTGCFTDTQPDEYRIDVPGLSATFYFNRDGIPLTTSNIKIEYAMNANSQIGSWKITGEDGATYFFDVYEGSFTVYGGHSFRSRGGNSPYITTAWMLTRMKSPDGKSQIDFTYEKGVKRYANSASEYHQKNLFLYTSASGSPGQSSTYESVSAGTETEAFYLKTISTSLYNIVFERETPSSTFTPSKLRRILVKNKTDEELKAFEFQYKNYYSTDQAGNPDNTFAMRYLLTSVQEQHRTNGVVDLQVPAYKFTYNETTIAYGVDLAEDPMVAGIDHWGYYSGPKPVYQTRIPLASVTGTVPTYTGIDRSPNPAYVQAGILQKVTLPHGGNVQFQYEPNDYSYVNNIQIIYSKVQASGLRIKKIIYSDGVDTNNDAATTYVYESLYNSTQSSGVIANLPQYFYSYNNTGATLPGQQRPYRGEMWVDDPILPVDIGYGSVIEKSNDGSFIVYNFYTTKHYPYTPTIGEIQYEVNVGTTTTNYYRLLDHPFFKRHGRWDHMLGILSGKSYHAGGTWPVRTETYLYRTREIATLFNMERIYFANYYGVNAYAPQLIYLSRNYFMPVAKAELIEYIDYEHYGGYSEEGTPPALEKITTYDYVSTHYQPVRITSLTSKNQRKVQVLKYPIDYPLDAANISTYNAAARGIYNLRTFNVYNVPVETYTYLENMNGTNQNLISARVNLFDPALPYLIESKEMNLYGPVPLSSFAPSHIDASLKWFVSDANYRSDKLFKYDAYGNIQEIANLDQGIRSGYKYDLTGTLPVAMIDNGTMDQIFYTSFEEDGTAHPEAFTGEKVKTGNYSVTLPSASGNYILSYWKRTAGSGTWLRAEVALTVPTTTTYVISNPTGSLLDEVRVYPAQSTLVTQTYNKLHSISSKTGINEQVAIYKFDALGRLRLVLNEKGEIVTRYTINFK